MVQIEKSHGRTEHPQAGQDGVVGEWGGAREGASKCTTIDRREPPAPEEKPACLVWIEEPGEQLQVAGRDQQAVGYLRTKLEGEV